MSAIRGRVELKICFVSIMIFVEVRYSFELRAIRQSVGAGRIRSWARSGL